MGYKKYINIFCVDGSFSDSNAAVKLSIEAYIELNCDSEESWNISSDIS